MSSQDFVAEKVWLAESLRCDETDVSQQLIAGDASPRKFYRVTVVTQDRTTTHILMVSPPTENNEKFVLVHGLLTAADICVPRLKRADLDLGFFLLEDLGDLTFWMALQTGDPDAFYSASLRALCDIQALDVPPSILSIYDDAELQRELDVCPDWFFEKALSMTADGQGEAVFKRFSECLLSMAAEQPFGFVHRDYHSRNLMVREDHDVAIIDFQDAIVGPITYDVVSLLKDVYIVWPRARQLSWLKAYWQLLVNVGRLSTDSWPDFLRWYDMMGLQRHVKILGVFSRLWLRDQKPAYMQDVPVIIDYIREACSLYGEEYSAVADFWQWFEQTALPRAQRAEWYTGL